jgi:hypothetical protein
MHVNARSYECHATSQQGRARIRLLSSLGTPTPTTEPVAVLEGRAAEGVAQGRRPRAAAAGGVLHPVVGGAGARVPHAGGAPGHRQLVHEGVRAGYSAGASCDAWAQRCLRSHGCRGHTCLRSHTCGQTPAHTQGKNTDGSGHYADGITNESVDDNKKRPTRYRKLQVLGQGGHGIGAGGIVGGGGSFCKCSSVWAVAYECLWDEFP